MCLQPEKRSQRHEQMAIKLRSFPHLGLFNAAALLDAPVVDFYPPAPRFQALPGCFRDTAQLNRIDEPFTGLWN